jgi:hypothetical protein
MSMVDFSIEKELYKWGKPGAWCDMDMLQVGNGDKTVEENQSHFDLWCIQASPLVMGNNLMSMDENIFTILSNREVIAVDQDSLGVQGRRVRQENNVDIWVKKMKSVDTVQNRTFAVVLANRSEEAASGSVTWADFGETESTAAYTVRDLWQHKTVDTACTGSYSVSGIPAHGSVHLLLTRKPTISVSSQAMVDRNSLSSRVAVRSVGQRFEVFVPVANEHVLICNAQGKSVAGFIARTTGWYPIAGIRPTEEVYLVSVGTLTGRISGILCKFKP